MTTGPIHDRGRGPEIKGTRITGYNLLPYFLDPTATEAYIGEVYELTPEQVAAARAYVHNNPQEVLARHLEIEAKMAAGNPAEVVERAKKTHATFLSFKQWLAERELAESQEQTAKAASAGDGNGAKDLTTFWERIAQRESRPKEGS
jgi:hypothetical protein